MKEKLDLELVCIYNDKTILKEFLLDSIEKQNCICKVTLCDGSDGKEKSAAAIYNKVIGKSSAKVIVCVHHDVSFEVEDILKRIYDYLSENPRCIIGAAGVISLEREKQECIVYGNVYEGINKGLVRLTHVDEPRKVLCIDECLFAFNKEVFQTVQFDSDTCNGWHFYAADLCYAAKEYGIDTFVYPLDIWHRSTGKIGNDFYVQLKRVQKKYRKRKRFITPCINCNTLIPAWYYKINRIIRIRKRRILCKNEYIPY